MKRVRIGIWNALWSLRLFSSSLCIKPCSISAILLRRVDVLCLDIGRRLTAPRSTLAIDINEALHIIASRRFFSLDRMFTRSARKYCHRLYICLHSEFTWWGNVSDIRGSLYICVMAFCYFMWDGIMELRWFWLWEFMDILTVITILNIILDSDCMCILCIILVYINWCSF